jgi:hypothetical protein
MEKLIELLNEYNEWWHWRDENFDKNKLLVISKGYWFIKWLVENGNIKSDWIKPRKDLVKEIIIVDYKTGEALWWKNKYSETEQLLMYLSIQENPVKFLVSILK